jgi:hypothetical protein
MPRAVPSIEGREIHYMRKIALAATLAVASFGALSATASAAPVATICGSVQVTVNGEDVVNNAACQALPPEE